MLFQRAMSLLTHAVMWLVPAPSYKMITSQPQAATAIEITWERPILHARIRLSNDKMLEVLNVHLKSRIPTDIPGQKKDAYTWKSSVGWAEGFFISSMRRVGQALEARVLIDKLFDENPDALIVTAGDFAITPAPRTLFLIKTWFGAFYPWSRFRVKIGPFFLAKIR